MRALVLVVLASACAQEEPPTFAQVQEEVLGRSCAFSSCHGASAGTGGLVLDGTDADYDRLVGVDATTGDPLVVAGDPDASYLVAKLEGAEGIAGTEMPPGGMLDAASLQLVRDWIEAGALR